MSYRQVQAALGNTPLQTPYGQSFLRAHGIVKDAVAQRARTSVMQRLPLSCAADALGALGTERGIDLGQSLERPTAEPLADYRERVREAWTLWRFGGCPIGMLVAFAVQGYYPEIVCANGSVYSVAPGAFGSGTWAAGTWRDEAAIAAELIIGSTAPLKSRPWNSFFVWFPTAPASWTTPTTPPTTSTVPDVYEIRRLFSICVNRWKPAWTECLFIGASVGAGPGVWGAPNRFWGDGGTWGSTVALYYPTD